MKVTCNIALVKSISLNIQKEEYLNKIVWYKNISGLSSKPDTNKSLEKCA